MLGITDAVAATTRKFPTALFVSTCGFITRDLYNVADRPENFYLVGSMGMAAPVGLGVALARPDKQVVILDGGGSFAMNLSILPMIAEHRPRLVHIVLDNGVHESTGGQRPVHIGDPGGLAMAAGYAAAHRLDSAEELAEAVPADGPTLLHIRCSPRGKHAGQRVQWTPQQIVARFTERGGGVAVDPLQPPVRSTRTVDLNLLTVRIATNLEAFDAYAYFSRQAPEGTEPDREVFCVDLDRDRFDVGDLARLTDRTLRAKRFRTGYYLNHVFGDPAYLVTRGRRRYVFGRRLERTVWPYFVKSILTDFAVDNGYLHLKAGGFVLADGGATLLVGANAGGKTVFLTQACLAGARFLSNTHLLVRDGVAYGVPSAVRIREEVAADGRIDSSRLTRHIEKGDFVVAPEVLFPGEPIDSAPVRNIVIADYQPAGRRGFEEISPDRAELFCDQFASAVTTYGLKDDLMAHCDGDVGRFTDTLHAMRARLAALVTGARCFRANVDMMDATERAAVLGELSGQAAISARAAPRPVAR